MTTPLVSRALIGQLKTLGGFLGANILGQDEVLGDICGLLRSAFCELRMPEKPVASMLFLGPTGVGKTETALLFTQHLFGDKKKLFLAALAEYAKQGHEMVRTALERPGSARSFSSASCRRACRPVSSRVMGQFKPHWRGIKCFWSELSY